jgi:ADP-ribosylglycohydrolase
MAAYRLPPDYGERVYAGWLGKCIGVRFGAPIEGWSYEQIREHLGEVRDYFPLPPGTVFKPDDDTSFPMIIIRALEDYGPGVTAEQMGQTCLNYLGDQHGTLWWGGYGVSTEHTAYLNLKGGIPAPLSGSAALNGETAAEQIGGQIFSDVWGLVAPCRPELAAEYAARASSVTHDGNGVYGGMYVAAAVSVAFGEAHPRAIIERALPVIPAESEYARVVRAVLEFHAAHPGDWRACYAFIRENFGYDRYPGIVHIIPNAGVMAMGMLYGEGDFSRTIEITNMAGWDTDCNVGNVGAITGVAVGLEGIPGRWREPVNDVLVASGLIGARNLLDIPACADLFARLGRTVAGASPLPARPRYHFGYPGATQGFLGRGRRGEVLALRQVERDDVSALQATVRNLNKKGEVQLFVRTYYRPDDLSANYYGASFSPKIYPGQRVRARLFLPAEAPDYLRAGLYVWDDNRGERHQATSQPLTPGRWHELEYLIPPLEGACLTEVGLALANIGGEQWTGSLFLDSLHWEGTPNFAYDFRLARPEHGAISQWTYLRGHWRLDGGAYHGSGGDVSESYSGDPSWDDYRLTARLTPLLGDAHNVNLRVQGALRSYAAGLAEGDRVVLYKKAGGYRPVAEAPFEWALGRSYEIVVVARGSHLEVALDGAPLLSWRDEDAPYLRGQIGLSNFAGCRTAYEEVAVSPVP